MMWALVDVDEAVARTQNRARGKHSRDYEEQCTSSRCPGPVLVRVVCLVSKSVWVQVAVLMHVRGGLFWTDLLPPAQSDSCMQLIVSN